MMGILVCTTFLEYSFPSAKKEKKNERDGIPINKYVRLLK